MAIASPLDSVGLCNDCETSDSKYLPGPILTIKHAQSFTGADGWLIQVRWHIHASMNDVLIVQVMACRLLGAAPLREPMLI